MELTHWARIAEIVGSIAIVASLIYVGIQVAHNTRTARAGTHQSLLDCLRETSAMLVTDAELNELVGRGEQEPGSLTAVERARFFEFASMRLAAYEAAYYNNSKGLLDTEVYEAWAAGVGISPYSGIGLQEAASGDSTRPRPRKP